jgi:DMSO/TMAO reductase YedYZ molybdopterin-dependent catalytic subunit
VGRKLLLTMLGAGGAAIALGPRLNPLTWLGDLGAGGQSDSLGLGFRIYTVNGIPKFDPSTWKFSMDGMVTTPQSLDLDALKALPQVDQISDFHCVTGWGVKNCTWTGVRLSSLYDLSAPSTDASWLSFYSADGAYVDSLSRDQAASSTVLLAHSLNGQPLTAEQGAPLRLVIPEMYGYKGVKWLNRIELKARQDIGFWEQRGYPADAYLRK